MTEQGDTPAREWKFDLPAPVSISLDSFEKRWPSPRQLTVRVIRRALVCLINHINKTDSPRGELTVGAAFVRNGQGRAE